MINMVQHPSPNFFKGRGHGIQFLPIGVVVHIMQGTLYGTRAWFSNPLNQVSAHYGVGLDGSIDQYVQEQDTAWANGTIHNPTWKLLKGWEVNPNFYTISVEFEGFDLANASQVQLENGAELIFEIFNRHNIPFCRENLCGHFEIDSIRRPNCPSKNLDEAKTLDKLFALIDSKVAKT